MASVYRLDAKRVHGEANIATNLQLQLPLSHFYTYLNVLSSFAICELSNLRSSIEQVSTPVFLKMPKSPFKFVFQEIDGIVLLTVHGTTTNRFVPTLLKLRKATQDSKHKLPLLVDLRQFTVTFSLLDIEAFIDRIADKKLHFNLRGAILYTLGKDLENNRFRYIETYAGYSGMSFRVFTNYDEAMAWLKT